MKLTLHFFFLSLCSPVTLPVRGLSIRKCQDTEPTSHKSQVTPPTFIYQYNTSNVSQHEKKKDVFFIPRQIVRQDI